VNLDLPDLQEAPDLERAESVRPESRLAGLVG
jgi:hypothetical protein